MKSLFAFSLSLLMGLSSFAADMTGSITLIFSNNRNYNVLIDGQRIYPDNKRVRLSNIHPGRHSIEVYSMNRNVRGNKSPVYASSFIVKPRYDVFIQMDYNGYVHISESRGWDDNIMNQKGKHGHYKNKNNNGRYGSSEYNNYSFEDDDRYSIYSNDKWRDGRREAINDYAFENIIESINEQWFNKQNVALRCCSAKLFYN